MKSFASLLFWQIDLYWQGQYQLVTQSGKVLSQWWSTGTGIWARHGSEVKWEQFPLIQSLQLIENLCVSALAQIWAFFVQKISSSSKQWNILINLNLFVCAFRLLIFCFFRSSPQLRALFFQKLAWSVFNFYLPCTEYLPTFCPLRLLLYIVPFVL